MRYSLYEIDPHDVVATTIAVDRDEALEWFSEKLRVMLTFEGDPLVAEYLLDEWPEACPTWLTLRTPPFRFSWSEQWLLTLRRHKVLDVARAVPSSDHLNIVSNLADRKRPENTGRLLWE